MTTAILARLRAFTAADPTAWATTANEVAADRGLPPVTADEVAAAQAEVADVLARVGGVR